ncbi:hypothetical protein LSH36_322g01008 [Paralvinella palmiformis]|uniref:Notch ligand N-terminal domain-containing protein n=1 Tax=Paralvinella palmiformis TaxID=53620 RepID=A0AAD9JGN3_9ANNE|nr:hypothetical protein LSH36_322g01008 [Paralvinella palmiformis]
MAVINRGSNTRQHFINDIRMAVIVSDIVIVTMTFYTLVLIESTTAIEGFIAITFERYSNPTGGAANGQCCDGRAFLCENHGCDYVFKLCLDDEDRYISISLSVFRYVCMSVSLPSVIVLTNHI